jgi:hypothetical protein
LGFKAFARMHLRDAAKKARKNRSGLYGLEKVGQGVRRNSLFQAEQAAVAVAPISGVGVGVGSGGMKSHFGNNQSP